MKEDDDSVDPGQSDVTMDVEHSPESDTSSSVLFKLLNVFDSNLYFDMLWILLIL